MKGLLTLLLIFSVCLLNAQIDKGYFDEIFKEEFSDSISQNRTNHSSTFVYTLPQQVPEWFINPPITESDEIYAIGISDPDKDSSMAYNQAINRAQIMANVLYGGITQILCDYYINEVLNTNEVVFEHFSRINAKVPKNGKFEIVNTYRNQYNETLVLIKYKPATELYTTNHKKVKFELYKNEIETGKRSEYQSVYEMLAHSATDKDDTLGFYQLTEFGKRYDVVVKNDKGIEQVLIYNLKYSGIPNSDSADIVYFSHGLWKEYYKSVMLKIISIARLKTGNIQSLSDTYQKDSYENITRGISVNKIRFVLTNISSFGKELKVSLKEVPIPN